MWPDNVPTILCYILAAIPSPKVSQQGYGKKHMFNYILYLLIFVTTPPFCLKVSTELRDLNAARVMQQGS